MNKFSPIITLLLISLIPSYASALVFYDDFDDGNLIGWTIKSGDWTNPVDFLLSSYNQYGVIWKDDSFGHKQSIKVDAYFDDAILSKSAQLRLRSGSAGYGPNPYWDHGYIATVIASNYGNTYVAIFNAVQPYQQVMLAEDMLSQQLTLNSWHSIEFTVSGQGSSTRLMLWVNGELYLDAYDTSGYAHDDGGYIALGSSNHINRRIHYDNVEAYTENPIISDVLLLEEIIASLNLPVALINAYDANVKKISTFIETGNFKPAINNLSALIKKVEHDMEKGNIALEDGEELIVQATTILDLLAR